MKVVGLMSGTSADGVTAALVDVGPRTLRVLRCRTFPYSRALKTLVLGAKDLRAAELSRLNFSLGAAFANAARRISPRARPALIGSHGQTIWHGPDDSPPNTLQLGEAAVIAELTGVPVIADFRTRDVAAGGQGAPLVPAFDVFLFGDGPLRAIVNIGGIANASLVEKGELLCAFDSGPGNVLLDEAMRRATRGRTEFDRGGRLAARGQVDRRRLDRLLSHPYFRRPAPKSLDRSTFGPALLARLYPRLNATTLPNALATLAEYTARTLALGIEQNSPRGRRPTEIIVSGGGALNAHLLRRLAALVAPAFVVTSDRRGMPAMAKEAACFAWLAARSAARRPGNAPAATGARGPRVLGKMTL